MGRTVNIAQLFSCQRCCKYTDAARKV